MLSLQKTFVLTLSGTFLASCSVHPVPINAYSGDMTIQIVHQIRCETKIAIMRQAAKILMGSPTTMEVGAKVNSSPAHSELYLTKDFYIFLAKNDAKTNKLLSRFFDIGITEKFNFDITDTTAFDASLGVSLVQPTHTFSATLASNKNKKARQGVRDFQTNGNFRDFIDAKCDDNDIIVSADYSYPMKGEIGVDNTIATYISLYNVDRPNYLVRTFESADTNVRILDQEFSDELKFT